MRRPPKGAGEIEAKYPVEKITTINMKSILAQAVHTRMERSSILKRFRREMLRLFGAPQPVRSIIFLSHAYRERPFILGRAGP
jgi:hypothetical protein